ncbi:hypothetical protein AVEN_39356-1 [Araneus ventricosus]|uniref:Uncharacterized protein n=1 Tax=Araneus ventricosus TaxID=182803 RepID=A0A4Y2N004_ARAVE|nr:hypothetical protein AVEN_39356-1 [Araneus ventricosus]
MYLSAETLETNEKRTRMRKDMVKIWGVRWPHGPSLYPKTKSNAKQDLEQRALAKWQRRWDDGINGRSTYEVIKKPGTSKSLLAETAHPIYRRAQTLPILSFPILKTPGQLLGLWRSWHASSLCHQVPPHAFLPPQVSSRSTHRSLDEINNQPPPANKQNNRPPQLYHQARRPT